MIHNDHKIQAIYSNLAFRFTNTRFYFTKASTSPPTLKYICKVIRLLLICCCFLPLLALGQEPVHELYGTAKGLPCATVYDIFQDQQGFLWVAHDKGLCRYDGNTFKNYVFTTNHGWACTGIKQSNDGRIWVVNFDGNVFYTTAAQDTLYEVQSLYTPGFWFRIFICNNQIIKPTPGGLLCYNPQNLQSQLVPFTKGKLGISTCFQNNNDLLLNTYQSDSSYKAKLYRFHNNTLQLIDNSFIQQHNKQHTFWISTPFNATVLAIALNSGITIKEAASGKLLSQIDNKSNPVLNQCCWQNNKLWLCTTNGVYVFDRNLQPLFNGQALFSNYSVSSVLYDREGILWLSVLNGGLIKVSSLTQLLYPFPAAGISALAQNPTTKTLYIGTANNKVYQQNASGTKLLFDGGSTKTISTLLFHTALNELAITSDQTYAYKFNEGKAVKIKPYVKDFYESSATNYAIATPYGYGYLLLPEQASPINSKAFLLSGYAAVCDKNERTRCVAYDKSNQSLYAGTVSGLWQWNANHEVELKAQQKSIIAADLGLYQQQLMVATLNDGFYIFQNQQVKAHYTSENGLLSANLLKVKVSADAVWLLSDKGLQCFKPAQQSFTSFSFANELASQEVNDFEVLDETIYLATSLGLVAFNRWDTARVAVNPLLLIDKFYCDKKEYPLNQEATYEAGNHLIEFYLSAPNFLKSNPLTIYYCVNNSAWQKLATGEAILTLPQLGPGAYTIQFKALNAGGKWSQTQPVFKFTILTPFYLQTWFWVLSALIVIAVIALLIGNEFRKQRLRAEKARLEKELEQSKLSSIKSQMNPHFLFNALNTIQSYIYQNDKNNASAYLGKFSELTRIILDMSTKEKVALAEELRALHLYLELELQRFEDKLQTQVMVDPALSPDFTLLPSMLIQPYIENAIKHGLLHKKDHRLLVVKFEKQESFLKVTIDDNGVGRKRAAELQSLKTKKHESFAMSANKKRLAILNSHSKQPIGIQIIDKQNEHGEASGTTVLLQIPI